MNMLEAKSEFAIHLSLDLLDVLASLEAAFLQNFQNFQSFQSFQNINKDFLHGHELPHDILCSRAAMTTAEQTEAY